MSQCLVVSRKNLEKLPCWRSLQEEQGNKLHALIPLTEREINEFLATVSTHSEFKERFGEGGVEKDPNFQQVIFYGIITRGSNEFFVYKRGDEGMSEKRLSSKLSVGVGGHIEPFDSNLVDSLYRELDEEVSFILRGVPINLRTESGLLDLDAFRKIVSVEIKGLIKNDSDDVGSVHVGLFCVVRLLLDLIEVEIKDKKENVSGSFMNKDEYFISVQNGAVPETWTQLVAESDLFPCK